MHLGYMFCDIEIRDYFVDDRQPDHSLAQGAPQRESTETEIVNTAWNPFGELGNSLDRRRSKQGNAGISGGAKTMLDVVTALLHRKWRKTVQQGYTLSELRKFGTGQLVSQFRLSGKNDLQQFGPGCFKIRKQSDRLQH